jgi:hypothetical protein
VALLALAVCAGCGADGPVVDSVEPDPIAPRVETAVTVHGGGFVNSLKGSVDNDPFQILDAYQVLVGTQAASSVARVDEGTLTALFPPLDEGVYDLTVTRPDGLSATLPGGVHVVGGDAGMPDDLGDDGGSGDGGPMDAGPPDLTGGFDMNPACIAPSLPSQVGPGPDLAITLAGIKLNGSNNFTHVAPGGTFTLSANYKITDPGNKQDQILIGLSPYLGDPNGAAETCLFNGTVNGTQMGGNIINLVAPMQPGTYTLRFHYGTGSSCNLTQWTLGGAPTSAEDFAAICVP